MYIFVYMFITLEEIQVDSRYKSRDLRFVGNIPQNFFSIYILDFWKFWHYHSE